ncbi:MAG: S-layer protein [Anaerocolumna sp.]|jgi:hypothetical protein|nr:S-layer protein [Anaerocolumna sp.]
MKKKILSVIIASSLLLSSTSVAFAKPIKAVALSKKTTTVQEKSSKKNVRIKEKKQSFKISGSPVIKYGKYKLPIKPITKGMGATVDFDKEKAILTVTKGTTTIVINFKEKTVLVNGVADTKSGIFTAKNDKKMNVLIKYIANKLGVRVNVSGDNITTEIPGLDLPTTVTVTPVGTNVVANTLNSTTLYFTATANVKAGQATGGKAELYVGSKLVATDDSISATDTTVTFTTADETPTNAELQALIPVGGQVTVKLYNAEQQSVISAVANPILKADYVAPSLTGITSAVYSVTGSAITLNVSGAGAVNDKVDVTKVSVTDTVSGITYQLTNTAGTGSVGIVTSDSKLTITLGSADKLALAGMKSQALVVNVAAGSLLSDIAGNTSTINTEFKNLPITITE